MAEERFIREDTDSFPPEMAQGSSGVGVNILLSWLSGWGAEKAPLFKERLDTDGVLKSVGILAVEYYQNYHRLDVQPQCGIAMREHMKRTYGFDLEKAIRTSDGITTFVQLNDENIVCYHGLAADVREMQVHSLLVDVVPEYLERGSTGAAVNFLLNFLWMWYLLGGRKFVFRNEDHEWFGKLDTDGEFEEVGAECLKVFQKHEGLEADGGFGPASRALALQQYRFDFEQLLKTSKEGSIFVQLNGDRIVYPPTEGAMAMATAS